MKRLAQALLVQTIVGWVATVVSTQLAVWNGAARGQWIAEAWIFGGLALILTAASLIAWGTLPPPDDDSAP